MDKTVRFTRQIRALLAQPLVMRLAECLDGVEVFLVGGAIRDCFLGLPSPDLDLLVAGDGERIGDRIAATLDGRLVQLGGDRFAAYRIATTDGTIDLWDRGSQTLRQDLARRDFSINSIAINLSSAAMHDPFGGTGDLRSRRLRATTPDSLKSDPLRVLRLVRFFCQLPEFTVEQQTLQLARAASSYLDRVASERIRDEIGRLLQQPHHTNLVGLLSQLELYPALWRGPSGAADKTIAQSEVNAIATELADLDKWRRQLGREIQDFTIDRFATSSAILFRGAAVGYSGNQPNGEELAETIANSHLLTQRSRALVGRLCCSFEVPDPAAADSGNRCRHFLHLWGDSWLDAVAVWGVGRGRERSRLATSLADLVRQAPEILHPEKLVNGAEVQLILGIDAGPEVGRVLKALERKQVEGSIRSAARAREFVRSWRPRDT